MHYTSLYYRDGRLSNMSQGVHHRRMIVAVDIEYDSTRSLSPSMRDREAAHAGEIHRSFMFVAAEDLLTDDVKAVNVVDGGEELMGRSLVLVKAVNL